jgi:hypothetical protein
VELLHDDQERDDTTTGMLPNRPRGICTLLETWAELPEGFRRGRSVRSAQRPAANWCYITIPHGGYYAGRRLRILSASTAGSRISLLDMLALTTSTSFSSTPAFCASSKYPFPLTTPSLSSDAA